MSSGEGPVEKSEPEARKVVPESLGTASDAPTALVTPPAKDETMWLTPEPLKWSVVSIQALTLAPELLTVVTAEPKVAIVVRALTEESMVMVSPPERS